MPRNNARPHRLVARLHAFFFAPIHAGGFGLLRIGWAAVALFHMLTQADNVLRYFGPDGILPMADVQRYFDRGWLRFSLLDWLQEPWLVIAIYVAFLVLLLLMLVGWRPRLTTTLSVLLFFSFQERSYLFVGGGDTVLRVTGFLLLITPNLSAFSVTRMHRQWAQWRKTQTLLPEPRMPVWPYRLLLWQFVLIYAMGIWSKLLGDLWLGGASVAIALHHPIFSRIPVSWADALNPLSFAASIGTLLFEAAWILLLLPSRVTERLKRWLLIVGAVFHLSIQATLYVSTLSLAILAGYLGLLRGIDFDAMRRVLNRRHKPLLYLLYDGNCTLCQRSTFWIELGDWLGRVRPVNFRDAKARHKVAPDIDLKQLDRSVHIRFQGGKTFNGFYAFRRLARHLPLLWPLLPFLYIPGASWIGTRIYARIAAKRCKSNGDGC